MCEKFIEVSTEYGTIRGRKRQTILGRNFYSFQKVPYMQDPVGKLRFADPQPPKRWEGTLDCRNDGQPFCNINFLNGQYEGNLDGVHLNVYSNCLNPRKLLPVMVWIHEGGIFTGNATESMTAPDYLMQKDIVLVTVQYRIGVFGFLSLDDRSLNVPGNAQFKDQVIALKWIQNNITNFGGDPKNVTLFGESWGGGATCYHLISDKSKGLFHRGILMSGTALNNIYSFFPRRDWAIRLCIKLGYDKATHSDREILEFLETANEKEIVMASATLLNDRKKIEEGFMMAFGPVIEPYDNGNAFLNQEIIKMAQNGWGKDIDILIGNTSNECLMYLKMMVTKELLETVSSFQRYVPFELGLKIDSQKRLEYAEILKKYYYGDSEPAIDNLTGLIQISNDFTLCHPMYRLVMSRLTHGSAKTFAYRFDYVSKNNLFRKFFKFDPETPEAIHGDDVGYIFRMPFLEGENFDITLNSTEFEGIKLMLDIFTNFASEGNPNSKILDEVIWHPVTPEAPFKGLNISEKGSKIINFPELDRIKVFDKFYAEQNKILY